MIISEQERFEGESIQRDDTASPLGRASALTDRRLGLQADRPVFLDEGQFLADIPDEIVLDLFQFGQELVF